MHHIVLFKSYVMLTREIPNRVRLLEEIAKEAAKIPSGV
jgi:hypothetical protein